MFRIYQVSILAVGIAAGLSTFSISQEVDIAVGKDLNFTHSDWAKTTKCADCHQPPQQLGALDAYRDFVASAHTLYAPREFYLGRSSDNGVKCGAFLVNRLDDSLLRSHLRLKEREALVVVRSLTAKSDSLSLEEGDVILAADGQAYGDAIQFRSKMDQNPQAKVELTLIREGKEISRTVAASDLRSPPKVYRIGVQVEPPSEALRSQLSLPANEGLIVLEVTEDSPAKASGVEVHDVLLQVDQAKLSTFEDLKESISKSGGNDVELSLVRKGKPMALRVKPIAEQESEGGVFATWLLNKNFIELGTNCPALRIHIKGN